MKNKNLNAAALGSLGGHARKKVLSKDRRVEIATNAQKARKYSKK